MRFKTIATILLATFILLVTMGAVLAQPPTNPLEFNEGLVLSSNDFDYHTKNTNKTIHFHVFDKKTGLLIPDNESECHHHLYRITPEYEDLSYNGNFTVDAYGITLTIGSGNFTEEGEYGLNIRCNTTQTIDGAEVEKGGYSRYDFKVRDIIQTSTKGKIIWTCPVDWTFPIIYMVLTLLVIIGALAFNSDIIGILGGIMLTFSYLFIGSCSPLLLSPVLVIGLLLTLRFGFGMESK